MSRRQPETPDWNALWIEQQTRNAQAGLGGGCAGIWAEVAAARKYHERSANSHSLRERLEDLLEIVHPTDSVLDIGAGTGKLAVPIARAAGQVTCVEPAAGMVTVLQENLRTALVQNCCVIEKKWDDLDIAVDLAPPYQLCLASYSLGMRDLRAALQKMMAVTEGTIVLYWHAGDQPYDREARLLWPLLRGMEHVPVPKADLVFNVLYQLGVYPHVRPIRSHRVVAYPSLESACSEYALRYGITHPEQEAKLKDYLRQHLTEQDGQYVLESEHNGMKIWWQNTIAVGRA